MLNNKCLLVITIIIIVIIIVTCAKTVRLDFDIRAAAGTGRCCFSKIKESFFIA